MIHVHIICAGVCKKGISVRLNPDAPLDASCWCRTPFQWHDTVHGTDGFCVDWWADVWMAVPHLMWPVRERMLRQGIHRCQLIVSGREICTMVCSCYTSKPNFGKHDRLQCCRRDGSGLVTPFYGGV